MPCSSSE